MPLGHSFSTLPAKATVVSHGRGGGGHCNKRAAGNPQTSLKHGEAAHTLPGRQRQELEGRANVPLIQVEQPCVDLTEPDLHLTLAFSLPTHMHTPCTVGGMHSRLQADCIILLWTSCTDRLENRPV